MTIGKLQLKNNRFVQYQNIVPRHILKNIPEEFKDHVMNTFTQMTTN